MQNPLFLLLRVILEVLSFLAMAMGMFKLELSRGESDVLRSSFRECTRVFRPPTSGFGGKCASSEPIPSLRRSIVVEVPLVVVGARAVGGDREVLRRALPAGAQSLPQTLPMASPPSSTLGLTHRD